MDSAPQEPANMCTHHVFMTVHVIAGHVSSDNTSCFPVTSNRGNAYVALFYIYDAKFELVGLNQEQMQRGAPVGHHRGVRLAYSPGILAHPPQNGQ
jgi:hypothetical protein